MIDGLGSIIAAADPLDTAALDFRSSGGRPRLP